MRVHLGRYRIEKVSDSECGSNFVLKALCDHAKIKSVPDPELSEYSQKNVSNARVIGIKGILGIRYYWQRPTEITVRYGTKKELD